jgi:hypothetical protein
VKIEHSAAMKRGGRGGKKGGEEEQVQTVITVFDCLTELMNIYDPQTLALITQ